MGRHRKQTVPDGTTKTCRVHGVLDICDISQYRCHSRIQLGCRICRTEQSNRTRLKNRPPKGLRKKKNVEQAAFTDKLGESVATKRVLLKVNKLLDKLNRS